MGHGVSLSLSLSVALLYRAPVDAPVGCPLQVVLDIDNQSTMQMRRLTTKLVQLVTLHSGCGNTEHFRKEIARQSYPGVPPRTRLVDGTARRVPLMLQHSLSIVPPSPERRRHQCDRPLSPCR